MAKHHYLPKFYQRRFSADYERMVADRRWISKMLMSGTIVPCASIMNEGQRPDFHGKAQDVEKAIGRAEGDWARCLREIEAAGRPPEIWSRLHGDLLEFIATQRGRTVAAIENQRDAYRAFEAFGDELFREGQIVEPPARESEREDEFHALSSILAHAQSAPLLTDLEMLFVSSNDDCGFVASDSPMVFANNAVDELAVAGTVAFGSPGLIVLCPLSPRSLLLLYDRNLYSTGRRMLSVVKADERDALQLNALQFAAADASVYFDANETKERHLRAALRLSQEKKPARPNTARRLGVIEGEGSADAIVVNPNGFVGRADFSFLRTFDARCSTLNQAGRNQVVLRHPELAAMYLPAADNLKMLGAFSVNVATHNPELVRRIRARARPYIGPAAEDYFPGFSPHYRALFT